MDKEKTEKRMCESMLMNDQFDEAFQRISTLLGRISEDMDEVMQKQSCLSDIYGRVAARWSDEDEAEEDKNEV